MARVTYRAERGPTGWTKKDDLTALAKKLIFEGKTVVEIANAISQAFGSPVTRNAILGYAWRNGLSIGKSDPTHVVRHAKAPKPAKQERKPRPPAEPVRRATPARLAPPRPPPAPPAPPAEPPPPPSGNFHTIKTSFLEHICLPGWENCRWIEGDVRNGPAFMCADPRKPGSSYCPHHHSRVWKPAPKYTPRVSQRATRVSDKNRYILQTD